MKLLAVVLGFCLAAVISEATPVTAAEISSPIVFGVRKDAPPFSHCVKKQESCPGNECAAEVGLPGCPFIEGYVVRICERIRKEIKHNHPEVEFSYKVVTTDETGENGRFRQLTNGSISILCGASTLSLKRMRRAETSLIVFISGASALHRRRQQIDSLESLKRRKLGVLVGTTTEALLHRLNKDQDDDERFTIVGLPTHEKAIDCLKDGNEELCPGGVDAYFADREILLWLERKGKIKKRYRVSDRYFTFEPYSIYVTPSARDLLHEVNAALVKLFNERSSLDKILTISFGKAVRSDLLDSLFFIQRIPQE